MNEIYRSMDKVYDVMENLRIRKSTVVVLSSRFWDFIVVGIVLADADFSVRIYNENY